jgi:hypothetical protein
MERRWGIIALSLFFAPFASSADADTLTIIATRQPAWTANGKSSTLDGDPLVVEVKKGDTLAIQVPDDPVVHHGFVTINKAGNANPSEQRDLVQACGENKPDAVLREVNCSGGNSNFGKRFTGTLSLAVMDKFSADVNFWCVVHKSIMWGMIRLKN